MRLSGYFAFAAGHDEADEAVRHGPEPVLEDLQLALMGLPSGEGGIFLHAIKRLDRLNLSSGEVDLPSLCQVRNGMVLLADCLAHIEELLLSLVDVDPVVSFSDNGDLAFEFPMHLILDDDMITLFMQAGAEVSLVFRPHRSTGDRLSVKAQSLALSGFDLDVFEMPLPPIQKSSGAPRRKFAFF